MIIGLDDLKFKMIERSKSSFNKLLSVIRRYGYPYSLVNESMSLWATKNFPIPFDSLLVQQFAMKLHHVQ